jgi:hypothetical protein
MKTDLPSMSVNGSFGAFAGEESRIVLPLS